VLARDRRLIVPARGIHSTEERELLALMNLGPRTLGYLRELGVESVRELAHQSADELFLRLQCQRGIAFDPCLHDLFTAVIAEAKGEPGRPWHAYTPERKRREPKGGFGLRAPGPLFGGG
jgi:hypothetical protein